MSTKIILATGCDAVFYNFLQETLSSWIRLGLPARADIGIVDMGLSAEQIAALEAQGYAIVVPGWTINVPQELRDGFMIGNVAKTALRDYFPGYDVYLWFDADAWAQTASSSMHSLAAPWPKAPPWCAKTASATSATICITAGGMAT